MSDEKSSGIAGGIRTGIGLLTAFKDALEETLDEAIARGDLSPERAKGVVRDAADMVQSTLEGARERFDVVSRGEYEALRREVAELRARLDRLDGGAGAAVPEPAAPTSGGTEAGIAAGAGDARAGGGMPGGGGAAGGGAPAGGGVSPGSDHSGGASGGIPVD